MEKNLPRVLVVEDEPFMMKIYKLKLKKAGFEVETAIDGQEALEKAQQGQFHIILLDLILPKVDGFQVLEQLKQNPQTAQIPVIVTTNLCQESDIQNAKKLGAADYLVKSNVSINELVQKVSQAVNSANKK